MHTNHVPKADPSINSKCRSSYDMACKTLKLLQSHVNSCDWETAEQLITDVKEIGRMLKAADSSETVPSNMVLRSLKIIRDEVLRISQGWSDLPDPDLGLEIMQSIDQEARIDYSKPLPGLRESIQGLMEEWESEMEVSAENIAKEGLQHVSDDEVILTLGSSKTVESFLKRAACQRSFQVIVAEGAPFCHGHDMAITLANSDIRTTVIPDSAIFTVLSRVTKVIIGTHSVTANGGLKGVSGAYSLALAAKQHAVPLIVLAAMFKYTPEYLVSHDQSAFNKIVSPSTVLPIHRRDLLDRVDVINPVFDYVPPELITVLIAGEKEGHAPSYVYHKLSTLYHREDYFNQLIEN